jgi:hypothetical protein
VAVVGENGLGVGGVDLEEADLGRERFWRRWRC